QELFSDPLLKKFSTPSAAFIILLNLPALVKLFCLVSFAALLSSLSLSCPTTVINTTNLSPLLQAFFAKK
ncbi:hypothetical protein PT281_07500, partial [Lactobacillus sp. ESL0701]|uniref:hypothetical protein n=1 Tax=Lactobacillus sp. ESL0701 TaxID=2983217 RepID=UPI0023F647B2